MKLRLMQALNRQHLRRSIARERSRLTEMRENSERAIGAQIHRIVELQRRLTPGNTDYMPTARDIARAVETRAKTALFA